jgi:hypothetical protein
MMDRVRAFGGTAAPAMTGACVIGCDSAEQVGIGAGGSDGNPETPGGRNDARVDLEGSPRRRERRVSRRPAGSAASAGMSWRAG